MSIRTDVAAYITNADYQAIIDLAKENQAKTLKFVQSHIYGDINDAIRWHAITAFGYLTKAYADICDEPYRNVLRRCLWAMNDESGNVPWSAPEVMAAIIKAAPKYSFDFTAPMLTNGLDNPMCHSGVLWAMGHLGEDFAQELAPFLAKVEFALNSSDPLLRGLAIWAFTRLKYQPAAGIIGSLVEDSEEFYLFSDDCLQKTTVGDMAKKYLQELK